VKALAPPAKKTWLVAAVWITVVILLAAAMLALLA
jgi:hypothetical protein